MRLHQDSQDARPIFHPEADNSAHLRAFFMRHLGVVSAQLEGLMPC
jgi:hypothetical protein